MNNIIAGISGMETPGDNSFLMSNLLSIGIELFFIENAISREG
jgi:hypothetical protein